MIHLLASIAQLGDKAPWVFLLQGESHQRGRVIEGAAYLGQRLAISSTDGFDLTRSLHDGFALARKKFGMPICTVEFNRLESGNAHEKLDILQQLEKQLNG